jgi:hypothetical protein
MDLSSSRLKGSPRSGSQSASNSQPINGHNLGVQAALTAQRAITNPVADTRRFEGEKRILDVLGRFTAGDPATGPKRLARWARGGAAIENTAPQPGC